LAEATLPSDEANARARIAERRRAIGGSST
jgi:hypothetical protein